MSAEHRTMFAELTPEAAIDSYGQKLETAQREELGYYSPKHLSRAQDLVKDARKKLAKNAPDSEIFTCLALCQKHLDEGYQIKSITKEQLAPVVEQKKYLDDLNVNSLYPGDYDDILDDVGDIIEDIEEGKLPRARENCGKLLARMLDLELNATIEHALGRTKTTWVTLEARKFPAIAPEASAEAAAAIPAAEGIIRSNVRNKELVAKAGRQATFAVNRALAVGEEVLRLQKVKPEDLEPEVLAGERRLQNLGLALGCEDVRDRSLDAQSEALAKCATDTLARLASAEAAEEVAVAAVATEDVAVEDVAAEDVSAGAVSAQDVNAGEAVTK